jgi:hypothetical protein
MTLEGTVESRNERGFKLDGDWINLSKYRPNLPLPEVGTYVRAEVDAKGFLKSFITYGGEGEQSSTAPASSPRLEVLKLAAGFAAGREEIKSADVLRIADCWLKWLEQ